MNQLRNISFMLVLQTLTLLCAALLAVMGVAVLLGWMLGLPYLSSLGAGYVPVAPSTATLFILNAIAILLRARASSSRAAHNAGLLIVLAGGSAASVLFVLSYQGIYLDIEHIGISHIHVAGEIPIGHMSPVTAFCFLIAFLSYLLLPSSSPGTWRANLAWGLACMLTVAGCLLLLAYLFGVPLLYGSSFIPPAALTSTAFVVLGIALMGLSVSHTWLVRYRTDSSMRAGYVYVLIFILLAVSLTASGYFSYHNFEIQFREQAEHQLALVAELKVNDLVNWRKERLADANLIDGNPAFSSLVARYLNDPLDAAAHEEIRNWLGEYEAFDQYDRVRLVNTQGATLISVPDALLPLSSPVIQVIPEVLRTGQITFVDFYRDQHDGRISLSILIPIVDEGQPDRVIALVTLRIDPNVHLYPYINQWPMESATAETLLVRREKNDVLFLNEIRFNPDAALNLRIPLTKTDTPSVKTALGQTGIVEGMDYRGKSVLADVRPVPDSPWFLVSKMDTDEIYAPLRIRLWQTFGTILMALLVLGAGLATVWRQQRINFYRVQAETVEALRESEERFRALVENSGDALTLIGADGKVIYEGPTVQHLTGYLPEDRINRNGLENVYPEDLEVVRTAFGKVMSMPGSSESAQFRSVRKDGTVWWTGATATNMLNNPAVRAIVVNYRDVTERRRTEEELRENEEKYRRLFENMALGVFQSTPEGKALSVNPAFARMFGYDSPEDVIKSVENVATDLFADPNRRAEIIRLQTENPNLRTFENVYRRKDGSTFLGSLNTMPIRDADGRLIRAEGIIEDITERKRAENMIEARLRLTEFSANHSLDELLTKTLDEVCAMTDSPIGFYHFVEFNQRTISLQTWSTRTMQEYCKAEGKGSHYDLDQAGVWADCIRERKPIIHNDYAALPASSRRGLPEGHAALNRELVVPIMRDGLIVAILGVGNRTQNYVEKDVNIVAYFADVAWEIAVRKRTEEQIARYTEKLEEMVTDRTQKLRDVQEQLVRQERLATLGQLAGSIGHELRNPLGVISNAIYFLKMALPDVPEKIKEYLDIIENETRTSDKIVTDLLDFTRIKSIDRKVVSVSDLIRQALERYPVPESVQVEIDLPADMPQAYADPQHVLQILGNLTLNAYQAMSKGGKLVISSQVQGDMICIALQDNGAGITPENMKKIFEPLFSTKTKGIGLGLAVSQKLAEVNDGRIEVQSEVGVGSLFSVYFPICKEAI